MITKEKVEAIVEKIKQMHRMGCEIDEQITSCGLGSPYDPRWHIFKYADFVEVVAALGYNLQAVCVDNNYLPYRSCHVLHHDGCQILVLVDKDKEVPES